MTSPPNNPFGEFFREELGHEPAPPLEPEAAPAKGDPADRLLTGQKAILSLDRKRRRGKTVTLVAGIHLPPHDLEDLARRLRQACGAGGTLDNGTIEIQGDQRNRVHEYLIKLGVQVRRAG